uniref:Uncharacterized protein n=1 Tax=Lutzomyia longipalpis TaxID=7200 RepID=A0A1B0CC12_LUTLO
MQSTSSTFKEFILTLISRSCCICVFSKYRSVVFESVIICSSCLQLSVKFANSRSSVSCGMSRQSSVPGRFFRSLRRIVQAAMKPSFIGLNAAN